MPSELAAGRAAFAELEELDDYDAHLAGSVAIEALVATGDLRTAAAARAARRHAAEADTALRPLAGRCRGLLLAAQGDHEQAIAALETATEPPDPPQEVNPFELGRTLLALGTVQRRAQHKRAARESLSRRSTIFERLGARLWSEKAGSELRRIGGRSAARGPALGDRTADRRARRGRPKEPRGRRRAQPQPEHRRVEPLEGLPQARRQLAYRARQRTSTATPRQ